MHQPVDSSFPRRIAQSWSARDGQRKKRPLIILGIVIALAIAAAIYMAMSGGSSEAPADTGNVPVVTVIVPGKTEVADTVSVTGTLAARRDMPVGVQGEGGAVVAVLADAGDVVGAGQVLARIDRSVQVQQVASLEASLRQARADAALAQAELDRAMTLVDRGFISKADIDRRTATRDGANARVNVAAAQLREGQARLGRLDVRSPGPGVVLERSVEPGQVVSAGSPPLFRVAHNGDFELQAKVAEQDLIRMRVGMRATVTPLGQQADSAAGTIWQLSPTVDTRTRQGIARIRLDENRGIRPGGFAGADIEVGVATVPLLPESSVLSDAKGNYVFVIGADDKATRKNVTVGDVTDSGITVMRGLTGSERIVLSAGAFLNEGDVVKAKAIKLKK